jgi:hypothetical protein
MGHARQLQPHSTARDRCRAGTSPGRRSPGHAARRAALREKRVSGCISWRGVSSISTWGSQASCPRVGARSRQLWTHRRRHARRSFRGAQAYDPRALPGLAARSRSRQRPKGTRSRAIPLREEAGPARLRAPLDPSQARSTTSPARRRGRGSGRHSLAGHGPRYFPHAATLASAVRKWIQARSLSYLASAYAGWLPALGRSWT